VPLSFCVTVKLWHRRALLAAMAEAAADDGKNDDTFEGLHRFENLSDVAPAVAVPCM